MDRLEAEPHAFLARHTGGTPEPVENDRARLVLGQRAERAAQDDDALRVVAGEPPDRRADRPGPFRGILGSLEPGDPELEERRHGRDAVRDLEPGRAQEREVRLVVGGQLHLPEADRVEAGGGVGGDVLREGRVQGRDRRERQPHERRGSRPRRRRGSGGFVSSFATR